MKYYELNRNKEGEKLLCRTENFILYSETLRKILCEGKMTDAIYDLLNDRVVLYKDKINYKYPGGNGFAPHQDCPAFKAQGQKEHITVLVAIDRATVRNGCLEIAVNCEPIWKNHIILDYDDKGSLLPDIVTSLKWHPIELEPGDIVFFGSYIPHRSGPNLSDESRRTIYLTFNSLSEGDKYVEYYDNKRKMFPPEIERLF
jgi:ectoine hydroxylase-related dioxygenase (phytanoyl-CoA dioxygenase family)